MSEFVAALPMYDWAETRAETDALWARIRDALREQGIDAPENLARTNAELPPVKGGIRDAAGQIIAPDPAELPPDSLDMQVLWRHPKLIFTQTCWGPMELGLAEHVRVVGQPDYSAYEGGKGEFYSSVILMRKSGRRVPAPDDGRAVELEQRVVEPAAARGRARHPQIDRHARGMHRQWRSIARLVRERPRQARDDQLLAARAAVLRRKSLDERADRRPRIRERDRGQRIVRVAAHRNEQPQIDETSDLRRRADERVVVLPRYGVLPLLLRRRSAQRLRLGVRRARQQENPDQCWDGSRHCSNHYGR
jgi:hypothetical protein